METLLNEFKALFADNLPEISNLTVNDNHGKIEAFIANNAPKLTEEQWKAVLSSKYSNLFEDGVPHVSWNTDRATIIGRIMEYAMGNRFGFEKLSVKTYDETWVHVRIMWLKTPCGTVLKCKIEEPHVLSSSRTRYYVEVIKPEDAPQKVTHIVMLISYTKYAEAHIIEQFAGSQDGCEEWLREKAKKYGAQMPHIKMIKIEE